MKESIRKIAVELGFDVVGFCTPEIDDNIKEAYESWVASGMNAGMDFMARNAEIRADLNKLLPDVQTVIVVALSYLRNKEPVIPAVGKGIVARYAQSRDYHKIFKKKLIELAEKAEDLAIMHSCITDPEGREAVKKRFESLVNSKFGNSASWLTARIRECNDLAKMSELVDKLHEKNRQIRRLQAIWNKYAYRW